jgi:hypothetical protein
MKLFKRLTSTQVLELLRDLTEESLPDDAEGELVLRWDDEDGVEIFFTPKEISVDAGRVLN